MRNVRGIGAAVVLGVAGAAAGQVFGPDGRLVYPPDARVPRHTSETERAWLKANPWFGGGADAVTPPPTGPIHCAAEYEPMDGIMVTWVGGQSVIQGQIGKWVTTTGNANLYVVVPNSSVQSSATATLTTAGANMSRVRFFQPQAIDSIWVRDYGPRYIYEGDVRAITDHKYNRSTRVNDDLLPGRFASFKRHAFYEIGLNGTTLVHGGGNYHLDALNRSYATRLISNENPWFTDGQIIGIWNTYQGLDTHLFPPFSTVVDATQHIDMWMQVIADDKVVIGDFPNPTTQVQIDADTICDAAAVTMAARGYTVYRTPSYSLGGTHFTYTNMVMCNDVVMVPSYGNATVSPNNAAVVSMLQGALPGKTIVQIPCDSIIGLAGAIHCIVMHIPAHKGLPGPGGGLAPTAYLRTPRGGEVVPRGLPHQVEWLSDDDNQVVNVDILLSTDSGRTFPTVISSAIADTGSYYWPVPQIDTSHARIRIVTRDAQGNTGYDDSDSDFTIGNPPPPCYANCDDSTVVPVLNVSDFICFMNRYSAGDPYANCDGSTVLPVLNVADFVCFQSSYSAGCR